MIIVAIFLTAAGVILAVAGIVASGAHLTGWWRRHNAEVTNPDTPHRTDSRFAAELARLAADLAAGQPETPRPFALPVSGRVDRDVVDQAAVAAHGANDTRSLQAPSPPASRSHQARHAAPDDADTREGLLDRLDAGGWTRDHLRNFHTPKSW